MKVAGQFIPGNTYLYKLDPRVKLLSNIVLIVAVFMASSITLQLSLLGFIVFVHLTNKMGIRSLIVNFRRVLYITLFLLVINLIIMQPNASDPWVYGKLVNTKIEYFARYQWWVFKMTFDTMMQTILVGLRIYIMILATAMLTKTTPPMGLTRAIEDVLSPLKIFRFPVNIIAMIMSIALRFIPTLMTEAQRIMKAQSSRGVDFVSGSLRTRSKAMITLVIPLFVSAFSKAEDLGNAMETRGYDPYQKRTRYRKYSLKLFDIFVSMIIIGIMVAVSLHYSSLYEFNYWWGWG